MSATARRAVTPPHEATDAPTNPIDLARQIVERAILPMTVVGLVAGLALTWAGNHEAASVAWTIPAVVVVVRLRGRSCGISRTASSALTSSRSWPSSGRCLLGEPFAAGVIARHAGHRRGAGALRAGSRSPRTDRPTRTGAARSPAIRRRPARDDPDRGHRPRRPAGDPPWRGGAGRWDGRREPGRSRRIGPHRRVPTDDPRGRRPGFLRDGQRRLVVRSPCHGDCRRQRVRGDRPPRQGGTDEQGAVRPPRRPVCPDLRPVHPGHLRGGVARLRRPGSRPRSPGRGDAVPAPARRSDRDRRRDLPRGAARRDRQGRRAARDPGTRPGRCCSTRPERSPQAGRGWPRSTSVLPRSPEPSIKARSSGWRPRSSNCRRTCSPGRSCTQPGNADSCCRCRTTSSRRRAPG